MKFKVNKLFFIYSDMTLGLDDTFVYCFNVFVVKMMMMMLLKWQLVVLLLYAHALQRGVFLK